ERIDILRDLRRGEFDVLVGINLLREGLDLPEVSLVAILDADKVTAAMKVAMEETLRRRKLQHAHNVEHGITPTTIIKPILEMAGAGGSERDYYTVPRMRDDEVATTKDVRERIELVREQMMMAAESLDFERAATLRDELRALQRATGGGSEARPEDSPRGIYAKGIGSAAYGGAGPKEKPRKASGRKAKAGSPYAKRK
ncbi:MAG: helicase-related protein, partial [Polyangiales bacterium]